MIDGFIRALIGGYLEPRKSVRQIISTGAGLPVALMMVAAGYLISATLQKIVPGIGRPAELSIVSLHISGLIANAAGFFILSALVYYLGKVSGGTGTRSETNLAVGWHTLVTSFLSPLIDRARSQFSIEDVPGKLPLIELPERPVAIVAIAAMLLSLWLLAQFVTELHRFKNPYGVAAVVMGIPTGMFLLVLNMLGAIVAQQQGLAQ